MFAIAGTVDEPSRHDIDLAIGILIGLRQCNERQAFREIATVVSETGLSLGTICRGLVRLASGTTDAFDHREDVIRVWGELTRRRLGEHQPA